MADANQQQNTECPICLNPMAKGAALFTTSCGHQFHFECIKDAIAHNNLQCPLCRGGMNQLANLVVPVAPVAPAAPALVPAPAPVRVPLPVRQQQVRTLPGRNSLVRNSSVTVNIPPEDQIDEKELAKVMAKNKSANDNNNAGAPLELLTLSSSLEFKEVAAGESKQVLAMLSVKAPPAPADAAASRVPLDLVAVVDRSGSMGGEKIELVKETLSYMLTQLTEVDRLSIVSFDDKVYPITGLMRMTSSARDAVESIVNTHHDLRANGGTDIELGLRVGLQVLNQRVTANPVTSVLLLTDGQDGSADSKIKNMLPNNLPNGCTVHCFGFGKDHDARVMSNVAEMAGGTFSYIENIDTVGEAFATCLGGLLSVVAQNIQVNIQPAQQEAAAHTVTKVHSHFEKTTHPTNGSVTIKVPDLFADERRDLMLSLQLPKLNEASSEPIVVATATVHYFSPLQKDTVVELPPITFTIKRPQTATDTSANAELDVQRNRILAADAIEEAMRLGDRSDMKGARELITATIATIQSSVSKDTPLCQGLLNDLRECLNRFADTVSYNQGGMAFAKSAQMQHKQQRAVASHGPVQSCYTTSNQMQQQSNVVNFKSKKAANFSSASSAPRQQPQAYPQQQQQQQQQQMQQQQQQQAYPVQQQQQQQQQAPQPQQKSSGFFSGLFSKSSNN